MFAKNTKILIIDDMLTIRKFVRKVLIEDGYTNILEAADGVQAWDFLNKEKDIGLIVSDWNMPNMTGIELLQKVRSEPSLMAVPFVLLTAEADISQVKQAVDLGVDNYVIKPFSPDNLKSKLLATYNKVKPRLVAA